MMLKSSNHQVGFEWCFKPFTVTLKLLTGVPIDCPSSSKKSCCLVLYGSILLLINAAINGYYLNDFNVKNISDLSFDQYDNINNTNQQHPTYNRTSLFKTDTISMSIYVTNTVFMVFGCHCCFFLLSLMRSPSFSLWDCFLCIERQLQLSPLQYRRIRNIVILALFILFLVISLLLYNMFQSP